MYIYTKLINSFVHCNYTLKRNTVTLYSAKSKEFIESSCESCEVINNSLSFHKQYRWTKTFFVAKK